MSDTEKDKDVTCFTADGVVAEMVIEVEENQKIGSDDLSNSPSKDNHCDKENDLVSESKDSYGAIVEREEENQIIESDTEKENNEESIESIETKDNNEECIEIGDKTSEEKNNYIVEDKSEEDQPIIEEKESEEENDPIVEDKICDEIIQNSEDKKSDEINDQCIEDNFSEIEQTVVNNSSEIKQTVNNKFSETKEKIDKSTEIKQTVDNKSSEIKKKTNNKSSEIKQKIDKSSEIRPKIIKNNQNLKNKRRSESIMNENDIKDTDMPRYPGRKRLANKWYISEDMITPNRKISKSVDFKDSPQDVKRRKIEVDSKEKVERQNISKDIATKKSVKKEEQTVSNAETPTEYEKTYLSRSLRNRKSDVESEKSATKQNVKSDVKNQKSATNQNAETDVQSEKSATKQNVLRKLPFRRNKDAPDIPDLKPKVFWWNGVGEGQGCKLGDIPEIRGRIQKAKSIRALYRVLFFQWPTNGQDIVGDILKFNGFPFDKSSYEYSKRQSLMKIMLDKTIFQMCELLDIRKGDKLLCIKNILDFLLNPSARIDPATDPRWQPVVLLERIKIDDTFFHQSSGSVDIRKGKCFSSSKNPKEKDVKSNFVTPTRSTRSSGSAKIELVLYPEDTPFAEKSKEDVKSNKAKLSTPIQSNRSGGRSLLKSTVKENTTKDSKVNPTSCGKSPLKSTIKEKASTTKDSKVNSTSGRRSLLKTTVKENASTIKNLKMNSPSGMKKSTPTSVTTKTKTSLAVKDEKPKNKSTVKDSKEKNTPAKKDIKSPIKELKSKAREIKNDVANKLERKKKFNKRRKKIIATIIKKVPENKEASDNQSNEESDEYEIEMTVDSGPDIDEDVEMDDIDEKILDSEPIETAQQKTETQTVKSPEVKLKTAVSAFTLSDSSETESAEETKLVTASKKTPNKVPMKRKGKPLRYFPKISDSIQNANFSALQRLHILLFGASDKAENLKSNILSFGGFPFLEGSDEWKQKHFLLSLLAQNNLREYLNLLCIPYAHDDQPTMINKLMRFLAVPSDESLENNNTIQPIETEVVSSVLVDSSPVAPAPKGKTEIKKKVKKKEEKKVPKRSRKILMSEEEARRLEANFAREQRALAREKKLPTYIPIAPLPQNANVPSLNMHTYVPQPKMSGKQPVSDPEQLNALLQTVYKRRALKDAGAVVSTPNKGQKTKLGDIENVKFLIVTSNLSDLEILHRLIYMLEASKSRIRKNILDFDGFGFNEDSPKYKHRMDYLNSLGYEASKRISFLLGLCPLNTNLPQKDLNELIMYFLMSPCKTKPCKVASLTVTVKEENSKCSERKTHYATEQLKTFPITQMPSDEPHIIVKSTAPLEKGIYITPIIQNTPLTVPVSVSTNSELSKTSSDEIVIQHSTPVSKTGTQKAKKTFPSSSKISPVKKVLLPPSQSPALGVAQLGNKPQKMTLLNSIPAVPAYSLPKSTVPNSLSNVTLLNTGGLILNTPKTPLNSLAKVPVSPGSKIQILSQSPKVAVVDPKIPGSLSNVPLSLSNVPGQVLQNQIFFPQISNKNSLPQVQTPLLPGSKMLVKQSSGAALSHEFIVQQQTPDGQQKVFKLIRLPPTHPLISNTVNKPTLQQTVSSPQLPQQVLLTTNTPLPGNIPPGLVIMKNNSGMSQMHILPNAPVKMLSVSSASSSVSPAVSTSQPKITHPQTKEVVIPDKNESASDNTSLDNSMEVLSSSEDTPPTDEDLFSSIQEIILSSNFEDITLRNVIERVAAQYPNHDLTHRHNYMKDCVKKIIIGTG